MKGRKPKPASELQRIGAFRPDRHAPDMGESLPVIRAESITQPLSGVVEQVMAEGVSWLRTTDEPMVALLRAMLKEFDDLSEQAEYDMIARRALRELNKQIITVMSLLGFDPTSRARLGITEVKTRSRLQEIQERARKAGK
jgi:phage terminase small subunit